MIRRRNYPGTYDRSTWEARQSDLPSQHMAVGVPYSNEYQEDIGSLGFDGAQETLNNDAQDQTQLGGPSGPAGPGGPGGGGGYGNSFVRSTWDSRPVLSQDWVSPVFPDQLNHLNDASGKFTVPQGYVGVIREFFYSPAETDTGDVYGNPDHTLSISIFRNGNPVQGYTFIDAKTVFPAGGAFECFILCNPGDVITGKAFFGGTDTTGVPGTFSGFSFYGQILINDGRDLPQYAGNRDCAPVCIDSGSIAAMKPPLFIPANAPGGGVVVSRPCCYGPPAQSVNDYLACIVAGGQACTA